MLVLEEVGVTALSPHNPLMSLHSLLDRGIEVDGQFVHLCIIGISNLHVNQAKFYWFKGQPSSWNRGDRSDGYLPKWHGRFPRGS